MNGLVSRAQSAFIKRRSTQDNFIFTQNMVQAMHRAKKATIFLKLDIKKAFDSVRWDYLLEVLHNMGFGVRWCEWISTLLCSASTSVLLNGSRGPWFRHRTGLRQDDPLSPLLFIISMEPLHKMFSLATSQGRLSQIQHRTVQARLSMYADDVAIFKEVQVVSAILQEFGWASGLVTNTEKSAVYPIHCADLDLDQIMDSFQCQVKQFPCTYLGLPLHTRALRRVDVQPLIDKVSTRLPRWKGRLLNKAGRLVWVNTVLSAIPVYFLSVFQLKKWALKKIDKIRRSFLWKGDNDANGGHCLVAWPNTMKPKKMGGLGIIDLERFSRALRLRWCWYQWKDSDRPWSGSEAPVDEVDNQLFRASTIVTIGDGTMAEFWNSSWIDGKAPRDIAPNLYKLAWRKHRKVSEEIMNHNWTRGLWRMSTIEEMAEFIVLWDLVQGISLTDSADSIIWRWTAQGEYTAKSAYELQFKGTYCSFAAQYVWKAQVEGKHRFFAWLLLQSKILTADRLLARNWPCNPICPLCLGHLESALHICLLCPFADQVWQSVHAWTHGLAPLPSIDDLQDWWRVSVQSAPKEKRRAVAAVLIYTCWNLWNEHNRRIFQGVFASPLRVFTLIKDDIAFRQRACGGPVL